MVFVFLTAKNKKKRNQSLFSGRELWVGGTPGEGPELVALPDGEVGGRVHVGLAEDDQTHVGVEVDLARTGAGESGERIKTVLLADHLRKCILRSWKKQENRER